MNKKGTAGQGMVLEQLVGIVLGGMIIFTLLIVGCGVIKTTTINQQNALNKIDSVIKLLEQKQGEPMSYATFDMEDDSAIVFLNENSNFKYSDGLRSINYEIKRPVSCNKDSSCVCLCQSVDVPSLSGEISCKKPLCKEYKSLRFKDGLTMKEVFGDKARTNGKWETGMLILRSKKITPGEKHTYTYGGAIIDIAGYTDKDLNERVQVAIKKTNNEIEICFKEKCE